MRSKLLFLAFIYFPGTVVHELSHYFMAKLLRVPTGSISLTPIFTENSLILGSVKIAHTDFFRRFLIGIAPLLVGVSALAALGYVVVFNQLLWWQYLGAGYLFITILNTMHLSRSDLAGAWKVLLILVLALVLTIALQWIYEKRI